MRTTFRTRLQGSVQFTARSAPGAKYLSGDGRVQDISTGGICFTTDKRLKSGDLIRLTIHTSETTILFNGEVVRIGESNKGVIVGVRFDIDHPDTEEALLTLAASEE